MTKYYLAFFKNDALNARSALTYGQDELFFVKVCKNPRLAPKTANAGCDIIDPRDHSSITQTLPTAASSQWEVDGLLAFDRLKDAHRAARFINGCSKAPKIVANLKREMRILQHNRWPDDESVGVLWNSTDRIRHVLFSDKMDVLKIALLWCAVNEIAGNI